MSGPGSRFKGKHSLDSDEEDEDDDAKSSKYDILASDDVEGTASCHLIIWTVTVQIPKDALSSL